MKQRFCSLIVLGPGAPNAFKFHLSRSAMVILVLAFLLSFFVVVWAAMAVTPPPTTESRTTLEAENTSLKLENANASLRLQQLDAKVAELETQSKRIDELVTQ
jgi:Tfp pilus assembly protein PilO